MTPLEQLLLAQIEEAGPMTLAEYMALCLMHPKHGYYVTRDPLGAAGDFTTAPEISQMFGELLGLSLAQAWLDQGAPRPFALAELGPGRGTLMADILRATRAVPGFHAAARLHLVETSPVLRAAQATALQDAAPVWCDTVQALPDLPLFLVANEFFDALPIRQAQRSGPHWRERMIGRDEGRLSPGLSAPVALPQLAHRLDDTRDGDIVEFSPLSAQIAQHVGAQIAARGGAAIIVDYGDWRALGDTFQALRAHAPADPYEAPGTADLTAHVDFEALALAAAPARRSRVTPQGVFLERLGITPRAQKLARTLTGAARDAHVAAHRRLTHPAEMGTLFKVMALYPQGAAPPPGLSE
ncbi:methyltransferase [Pelagivirga sediminicola]|uniref:Methyltransferase n=1 Tax=Pelagivirga sediminicola TaxID=2170575 RepID=A0A2T7G7D7_9RHOB|nr:SAM-dependent methyltransferase [Pelagivirga sediminicola]PVA10297.1 methyltransferase [Pelagivirga sediminicola]